MDAPPLPDRMEGETQCLEEDDRCGKLSGLALATTYTLGIRGELWKPPP